MSHRHSKHGFRPTADSWNRFANARVCGPSRHELSLHYAVPHFGVTAHPTAVPADLEGASKNSCFRTPHGSPPSAVSFQSVCAEPARPAIPRLDRAAAAEPA